MTIESWVYNNNGDCNVSLWKYIFEKVRGRRERENLKDFFKR